MLDSFTHDVTDHVANGMHLKPYNAIFKKQSFGKKQSFDQTSSYLWAFQAPGTLHLK